MGRGSIVVRLLGWDMKVPGSIPADVNYTGHASDTSKSLGECLRLRGNHNSDLNGRLAESNKINITHNDTAWALGVGACPATGERERHNA